RVSTSLARSRDRQRYGQTRSGGNRSCARGSLAGAAQCRRASRCSRRARLSDGRGRRRLAGVLCGVECRSSCCSDDCWNCKEVMGCRRAPAATPTQLPNAQLDPPIVAPESVSRMVWTAEDSLVEIIRGRLEGLGPVTVRQLMDSSGLNKLEIETALLKLEAEGFV